MCLHAVSLAAVLLVPVTGTEMVFEEEFDRLPEKPAEFNSRAEIWESPPSFKDLMFKPEKMETLRKTPFAVPGEPRNYVLSFRFRFMPDSKREFVCQLFTADGKDKKKSRRVEARLRETGSVLALPGAVNTTPNERPLPGFPSWRWHKAEIRVDGGMARLFVERDGVMALESYAPLDEGVLTGLNFAGASAFGLDSIRVTSVPEQTRAAAVQTFPFRGDTELTIQPGGMYPAQFAVLLKTADGKMLRYPFRSFGEKFDRTIRVNGKDEKVKTVLPDAGFVIRGPGVVTDLRTRPRLRFRYQPDGESRIVAQWDSLPAASKQPVTFRVKQIGEKTYEIWLNGKLAGVANSAAAVTELEVNGLTVTAAETKRPVFPASADLTRYLPVDPAATANGEEIVTGGAKPVVYGGIPFLYSERYARPLRVCEENLGSYYLECDGYLERSAFDAMPSSVHFSVPVAQYNKAYALCKIDPAAAPEDVPVVTARLTNFAHVNQGRAQAVCDTSVTLPAKPGDPLPANVKNVGTAADPLYLVEFDFDVGSIDDVIFYEKNVQLDFEFLGMRSEKDNYYLDRTRKPSDRKSSVVLYGAALAKSPAVFRAEQGRVSNTFYPDEKPGMTYEVTPLVKGDYTVTTTVTSQAGKTLFRRTDKITGPVKTRIDFEQRQNGWYGVKFELKDAAGKNVVTRNSAFVLLPPDDRKAGYESPYFSWNFRGAHFTPKDIQVWGPMLKRMGVRRTHVNSEQEGAPWGLTLGQIPSLRFKNEADAEKQIRDFTARYPHVKQAMIFHESGGGPFPLELNGGETQITPKQLEYDKQRVEQALSAAEMWRKFAPDVKLVIGNSGHGVGLLAQLFRQKFPRNRIDFMGEESVGMTRPPERETAYSNWQLKRLAELYGYKDLFPEACYEWKSRLIRHYSKPDLYAAAQMRTALVGLAWRQNLIGVPCVTEMANSYYNTVWGGGAYTRFPLMDPTPAAAALATLTRALDCAAFVRMVPTGSRTVYALEFRRGAEFVYVLWSARGEAGTALTFEKSAAVRRNAMCGAETTVSTSPDGVLKDTAGERPVYFTASVPVKSIAAELTRTYPDEQYKGADKAVTACAMDDASAWKFVPGVDSRIVMGVGNPGFTTFHQAGKYELRTARDAVKGACLEVELRKEGPCPETVYETGFFRLTKPAEIPGAPNTLGVWCKGNSSWGKVYFEIIDAEGEVWLSAGTGGYGCDVYDWPDFMGLNFDGWHFLSFPLTGESPVKVHSPGENQWQWQRSGNGNAKIDMPVKLTGFGVSMFRKALVLTEMQDVEPVIRFKNFSVY